MKNSYDQINIQYLETKNVSTFVKFPVIILILIFTFIPLVELIEVFNYNYAAPYSPSICLFDWSLEPLQFKSLPISN